MEEAKKRRAATKGWLSRERQLVARLDITQPELTNALADLKKRQLKLETVQEEIEQLFTEDELSADIDQEHSFLLECRSVKATAELKLLELQQKCVAETLERNEDTSSIPSRDRHAYESARSHQNSANLPKIQMTSFFGDYTEWPSFYDSYRALIDEAALPDITKFSYLQSLLSGEALSCIKGLSLTGGNYRHALEILKERYDRKEKIVFDHVQKLLATEVNVANVKNMWTFYNLVQSHIRCLENFGISGEQYGVILTPLILSRLPGDFRMKWARTSDKRESDLGFLMEFLLGEIQRHKRSQHFELPPTQDKTRAGFAHEKKKNTASAQRKKRQSESCACLCFL